MKNPVDLNEKKGKKERSPEQKKEKHESCKIAGVHVSRSILQVSTSVRPTAAPVLYTMRKGL